MLTVPPALPVQRCARHAGTNMGNLVANACPALTIMLTAFGAGVMRLPVLGAIPDLDQVVAHAKDAVIIIVKYALIIQVYA